MHAMHTHQGVHVSSYNKYYQLTQKQPTTQKFDTKQTFYFTKILNFYCKYVSHLVFHKHTDKQHMTVQCNVCMC
jgi:hypothetical protein